MRRSISLLAALSLSLAACAGPSTDPGDTGVTSTTGIGGTVDTTQPPIRGETVGLQPVDDCDVLLDYFVEQALEQVGPWGLVGGPPVYEVMEEAAADSEGGGERSSAPSSTNVQVEGVDEGDIVKAAGDHLYVLSDGRLVVFSTADGSIDEIASLELSSSHGGHQMLLDGGRLAVIGAGFAVPSPMEPAADIAPSGSALAQITLIDVADPADPAVTGRLTLDGTVVTTRLVDGHLRVVLEAYPVGLEWSHPEGSGLRAEREATERNREIIRESTIENWLPYYVADGDEGTLLDCSDVLLPPEPSGLGTLSILDFDLDDGIDEWRAASVVASGSTVYANTERTYVATQRWFDPEAIESDEAFTGHVTRIHRFETPVDGTLTYTASGDVQGFLLNQFAMDEYEGRLRVASTTAPTWWGRGGGESESMVTVLDAVDDRLRTVGSVAGLGVTETIRAVRFMGPVGYVVTFRQTDPLYVIDLSDPTEPTAEGELKIPGYSAYLHPVGEGRLLGVGQDADPETGAVKGLQLSLFDVSAPTAPKRLDTFGLELADGVESHVYSPVEGDHKAFTMANGTGFVPFEGWAWSPEDETETARFGVIAADWSDDTLDGSRVLSVFEGKPRGDEWVYAPQRVVVKGAVAYAVGHGGVSVIDLDTGVVSEQIRY